MGKMSSDPLVSTEAEIEVDKDTAAAIERGIDAADNDQVVSADEARERLLTRAKSFPSAFARRAASLNVL
jgi:hypothetical protein